MRRVAAFFNVGDVVVFGKYLNKRARVVAFHDDGKGNPLVELEPVPKGRKKNKVIALFKIRHTKPATLAARNAAVTLNVLGRFAARLLTDPQPKEPKS